MTPEQQAEIARVETRLARLDGKPGRETERARLEDTLARLRAAYGRGPGRPALPADERRRAVNLTLSPETVLALDVLAEARGASRSGVVEQLVREALSPPRARPVKS